MINIPDSIYKLGVLLGVVLIGFFGLQLMDVIKDSQNTIAKYNSFRDSVELQKLLLDYEITEIVEAGEHLSRRFGVENPVIKKDSSYHFIRVLTGNKAELLVGDSIWVKWNRYSRNNNLLDLNLKKLSLLKNSMERTLQLNSSDSEAHEIFLIVGFCLLVVSVFSWVSEAKKKEEIENRGKNYPKPYCQSCGRKFSSMVIYGSEKNGDISKFFCFECYQDGEFTEQDLAKDEVIRRAQQQLEGADWLDRKVALNRISKLDRWRKHHF